MGVLRHCAICIDCASAYARYLYNCSPKRNYCIAVLHPCLTRTYPISDSSLRINIQPTHTFRTKNICIEHVTYDVDHTRMSSKVRCPQYYYSQWRADTCIKRDNAFWALPSESQSADHSLASSGKARRSRRRERDAEGFELSEKWETEFGEKVFQFPAD